MAEVEAQETEWQTWPTDFYETKTDPGTNGVADHGPADRHSGGDDCRGMVEPPEITTDGHQRATDETPPTNAAGVNENETALELESKQDDEHADDRNGDSDSLSPVCAGRGGGGNGAASGDLVEGEAGETAGAAGVNGRGCSESDQPLTTIHDPAKMNSHLAPKTTIHLPSEDDESLGHSEQSPDKFESDDSPAEVIEISDFRRKVTTHYDRSEWKRSRVRDGMMIARIAGYDIVETEYGVSYLWVVTRQPAKRTSANSDEYEHAGFYTWQSLEASERLVTERKDDGKRISKNRSRQA